MAPTTSKARRIAGKILGLDNDDPQDILTSTSTRFIPDNIEPFYEEDPTVKEWLREHQPTGEDVKQYIADLFPFVRWIFHYNWTWLVGDVVAGVTVGFVVIPQGMAYALLAQLPPEYGLYTSFVGFLLYWAFATSKDITIGTVAVMSQLVGNTIIRIQSSHASHSFTAPQIARALSVIAGAILLLVGLLRLGWIVEFIPLVAISAFMTGAAISIAVGQVPTLLGIKGVNTRAATYKVVIDTLKSLGGARRDAAVGLSALVLLYLIRWGCSVMGRRQKVKSREKVWFFVGTLRMTFVVLLYILISFLANRGISDSADAKFKILGDVPSGFQVTGAPLINTTLLGALAPDLPATVIVLIIEHIAISKSFGRINNYVINPSQELVAVGFTNLLGPFLGAYPATGSFSRTAIKSKAGVRTPLAGIFTAVIVLLALYVLTKMFFYIPMSALSGLIIHAVGDLITPPSAVARFWKLSPLEVPIFAGGVLVTVFVGIEDGIYFSVAASAALLLWRMARGRGSFLGRVRVGRVANGDGVDDGEEKVDDQTSPGKIGQAEVGAGSPVAEGTEKGNNGGETARLVVPRLHDTYLPLSHHDGSNPKVPIASPHPGIFVYRFAEGLNYTNQAFHMDTLIDHIFLHTRRTELQWHTKVGDRPWNDPGPRPSFPRLSYLLRSRSPPSRAAAQGSFSSSSCSTPGRKGSAAGVAARRAAGEESKPVLRAIVLDFSTVNNLDVTSVQGLIDVRNQLGRYAAPDVVQWHFAGVRSRWARRALAVAGVGIPSADALRADEAGKWRSVFSVAPVDGGVDGRVGGDEVEGEGEDVGGEKGGVGAGGTMEKCDRDAISIAEAPRAGEPIELKEDGKKRVSAVETSVAETEENTGKYVAIYGLNRRFFHIDVPAAVESVLLNIER